MVWEPSQCDFVVYSVSGHLRGRTSVCVESGRVIESTEKPPGAKKKEREKRNIKERERDFSQQAQFRHGNLMP